MHSCVLTGNAGSGKSTLARLFQALGIDVISADDINRQIIRSSPFIAKWISRATQQQLVANTTLDVDKLRTLLFESEKLRTIVERTLHPLILENINLQRSLLSNKPYCILEIPLFFESEYAYPDIDSILLVTAPEDTLVQRISSRRKYSSKLARQLLNTQLTDRNKFLSSNDIVVNSGNPDALSRIVTNLHHRLLAELNPK